MSIRYVKGDATEPQCFAQEAAVIVHCCNDVGGWGSGFVLAISRRWKGPESAYREWHRTGVSDFGSFELGGAIIVPVEGHPNEGKLFVANLIGQRGHKRDRSSSAPYVRYEALRVGLSRVAAWARENHVTIHMPRIGCGLAGGTWDMVEPILSETMGDLDVTIYDLE